MARRIYLHVGTMKSGTTYLQQLFDLNKDRLADQEILWQGATRNRDAMLAFLGSRRSNRPPERRWQGFSRRVRRYPGDVLISCEIMAPWKHKATQRLRDELGDADVRLLVTARDLTKVVPSHWQETVKNGATLAWKEWIGRVCQGPEATDSGVRFWRGQYLPEVLDAWSTIATPGQVYVVTAPQHAVGPEVLWTRFAAALENPPAAVEQPTRSNPSLGAVSAELMRRMNARLTSLGIPYYSGVFKRELAKQILVKHAKEEPRIGLSRHEHEQIRGIAETMVAQVRQSGATVIGDLADLVPGDWAGTGAADPGESTDAELLDAAILGLVGLGVRVARRDTED
jgi:hypothetical protein